MKVNRETAKTAIVVAVLLFVLGLIVTNVIQLVNSNATVDALNGKIDTQNRELQALIAKTDKQSHEIEALRNKVEPRIVFLPEPKPFVIKWNWTPRHSAVARELSRPLTQSFGLVFAPFAALGSPNPETHRKQWEDYWAGYMSVFGIPYGPRHSDVAQLVGGMNAPGFSKLVYVAALNTAPTPAKNPKKAKN